MRFPQHGACQHISTGTSIWVNTDTSPIIFLLLRTIYTSIIANLPFATLLQSRESENENQGRES